MVATAPRLDRIRPSASYPVTPDAPEMRAASIGESDFPIPPHVCDADYDANWRGDYIAAMAKGVPIAASLDELQEGCSLIKAACAALV